MAASPEFRAGLARLIEAAERHRIAAMCSEKDPLDCHRCLLVGRALATEGVNVGHILPSGEIMGQAQAEERLLGLENLAEPVLLFESLDARLTEAYRSRARKIAHGAANKQ
jgi:hypothetical protein